jgi:UDP-glucuronate 4-epimerase
MLLWHEFFIERAMTVLVTGSAGFIGSFVAHRLLDDGHQVIGLDNVNDYYDVRLKQARLDRLIQRPGFTEVRANLEDAVAINRLFEQYRPTRIVHLAAQAGVRYAAEQPQVYVQSNVVGFLNILEAARHFRVAHLLYASTSSVYGANTQLPFAESDPTAHPISLYAASKKANELMAHSYAHLFGVPCTGLRFFTVYGPWGRPDMALFKFARAMKAGKPIELYNNGAHRRSFTYIADVVEGIVRVLAKPAQIDPGWDSTRPNPGASGIAPYRIYNIGSAQTVPLLRYVELLEENLGVKAQRVLLPLQAGDVPETEAAVEQLFQAVGYCPQVGVEEGVRHFVEWLNAHPQFLNATAKQ